MSEFFDNEEILELRLKFIHSAKEKTENIEVLILRAERQKNQESSKDNLKTILATLVTIKVSAQIYKFDTITLICHRLEDYISELLTHNKIISSEELSKMLKHIDLLSNYYKEFLLNKSVNDKKYQDEFKKLFWVAPTIEVLPPDPKTPDADPTISSNLKLQILIVGINKTIMKQVYAGLEEINYIISFADNALEALHRLSLEKFDLIISSHIMGPIDGVSFSLAVKSQWRDKAPNIILLSSEKLEIPYEDSLCPEKIFVKSLTWPSEMDKFLKNEYPLCVKPKSQIAVKKKMKIKSIFFVEDDQNILDLFLMVFTAERKVTLFNEVTKSDPYKRLVEVKPDLIICDIHVPNVDIINLILKIKTSEELSKIPVVVFTGDPDQPIASKLLQLGALAVLDKTIILTSMFEELEKLGLDIQTNV